MYAHGGVSEAFRTAGEKNSLGGLPRDYQDGVDGRLYQCLEWSS